MKHRRHAHANNELAQLYVEEKNRLQTKYGSAPMSQWATIDPANGEADVKKMLSLIENIRGAQ